MSGEWLRVPVSVQSIELAREGTGYRVVNADIARGSILRLDGHDLIVDEAMPCGSVFTVVGGSIVRLTE